MPEVEWAVILRMDFSILNLRALNNPRICFTEQQVLTLCAAAEVVGVFRELGVKTNITAV